jgi:hypothetical protein
MKIPCAHEGHASDLRPKIETQTTGSRRRRILGLGFALLGCLLIWTATPPRSEIDHYIQQNILKPLGADGFSYSNANPIGASGIRDIASTFIRNVGANSIRPQQLPILTLDIKFTDLETLAAYREQALIQGIMIQGEDDFVPASLRVGNRVVRVKLRLKGDWVSHASGDKWSVRVHVRDDQHVFGMRRFSLQAPETRNFQSEPLLLDMMRAHDVLAPRYQFVDLWVNGTNIGVMAIEEHFSSELLENQNRRASVILKLSEDLVWRSRWSDDLRGFGSPYADFTNSEIEVFRSSAVARSVPLSRERDLAIGILRGWIHGNLPTTDVFHLERVGRFLAISEFWGAWHALRWHNLRFAFDPIAARLEPIAFDATINTSEVMADEFIVEGEPIIQRWLLDPVIRQTYQTTLQILFDELSSGNLRDTLEHADDKYRRQLAEEYLLLDPFPIEYLEARAEQLTDGTPLIDGVGTLTRGDLQKPVFNEALPVDEAYPQLLRAYILNGVGTRLLELESAIPAFVSVVNLDWIDQAGRVLYSIDQSAYLPIALPPKHHNAAATAVTLPLNWLAGTDSARLRVTARIGEDPRTWEHIAAIYVPPALQSAIPRPSVDQAAKDHDFLDWDAETISFRVKPGDWIITETLSIPGGVGLQMGPGTRMRFDHDAALIVRGPLHFEGTEDQPVTLEALARSSAIGRPDPVNTAITPMTGETWPGLVVLNASTRSIWQHVDVRDTRGVTNDNWSLTGGVTFYESPVQISNSSFAGHRGEDALNIVRAEFQLLDVDFSDAVSDAFDADFANGNIFGGSFENIGGTSGGDAIDVSGSEVAVNGTTFRTISDKAVSVGEASIALLDGLDIVSAGAGVVAKDGSRVTLTNTRIDGAELSALMAYIKKPEYGGAQIMATNVDIAGPGRAAIVQYDSLLSLNGRQIAPENVDVDLLYTTLMNKGVSQ